MRILKWNNWIQPPNNFKEFTWFVVNVIHNNPGLKGATWSFTIGAFGLGVMFIV